MSFVLDNSVAIAWCFEDEQTPAVMSVLDRVTKSSAMAPMLWPLEATNALLVAERKGRLGHADRAKMSAFLGSLPIFLDEETALRTWNDTADLAARFRLTIYDASYLELAHRRRLPIATLDRQLCNAAKMLAIELLIDPS